MKRTFFLEKRTGRREEKKSVIAWVYLKTLLEIPYCIVVTSGKFQICFWSRWKTKIFSKALQGDRVLLEFFLHYQNSIYLEIFCGLVFTLRKFEPSPGWEIHIWDRLINQRINVFIFNFYQKYIYTLLSSRANLKLPLDCAEELYIFQSERIIHVFLHLKHFDIFSKISVCLKTFILFGSPCQKFNLFLCVVRELWFFVQKPYKSTFFIQFNCTKFTFFLNALNPSNV